VDRAKDGPDALGGSRIGFERDEVAVELVETLGALDQKLPKDLFIACHHTGSLRSAPPEGRSSTLHT